MGISVFVSTILSPFLHLLKPAPPATNSNPVPPLLQGYGAAWNMLTPARELRISAMCVGGPGKRINFTVGSGGSNQSICKTAHYFADA
jgi:hypothetical protein